MLGVLWMYPLGDIHTPEISKRAMLDYTTEGNMLGTKRKLEFVDSWFNHDEDKEDQEDFAVAREVLNCLGTNNLGGAEL